MLHSRSLLKSMGIALALRPVPLRLRATLCTSSEVEVSVSWLLQIDTPKLRVMAAIMIAFR